MRYVLMIGICCPFMAFAQTPNPPSLSEIEQVVRDAYAATDTIEVDVDSYRGLDSFDAVLDSLEPEREYHSMVSGEKIYFNFKANKNGEVLSDEVFVWDGNICKGISNYSGSTIANGYVSDNPDYLSQLSVYPLTWNIFSPASSPFYWFNSTSNTLSSDTVMIDGHECYLITTDDPVLFGSTQTGRQYRSYVDPAIGFMLRRVDKMDHIDPEMVIESKRYLDYEQLDSGLWYAWRMEIEGFRRNPDLPTHKHVYSVNSVSANQAIEESQFTLEFPVGIEVYDEQKIQHQQRLDRLWRSPLTAPIIFTLCFLSVLIGFKVYIHRLKKG